MADIVNPGEVAGGVVGTALMPRNLDLVIYQGDDFDIEIELQDAATTPINLTGYTGSSHFRRNYEDTNAIPATITIADDGLSFFLSLSAAQTEAMSGDYIYDVQLTNPDGKRRTYLTGDVVVSREVTK